MVDVLIRQRHETRDPARASAVLRSVLGTGEVTAEGALEWSQRSLVDDGITVTRLTASAESIDVDLDRSPDLNVVAVRDGEVGLTRAPDSVVLTAGGLGLVPFGESVRLTWRAATIDVYSFPLSSLLRQLQGGDGLQVHAPRLTPRSAALGTFWDRLARVLAGHVLDEEDLYARDLLRGQVIDALIATTIEAFDLADGSSDDLDRDGSVLQRAILHMEDNLHRPIAITDVARAAGVSVRGLQLVFQRRRAETPLAHLRRLRVIAARQELQAAAPGSTTVGAVARRFGYTNAGRFGTHYRDEFDESPAVTLRRVDPA